MRNITILEDCIRHNQQKNWYLFLCIEKQLVETNFDWLQLKINEHSRTLNGFGSLSIAGKKYKVELSYSPFNRHRFDRIFIKDEAIKYNREIHLYTDNSLCLYHPVIDKPLFRTIPLVEIVPWITEWVVMYEQWKKYGVWLGKEISH